MKLHFILQFFFYVYMSNDTRLETFVIKKNSKINHGFLLVLD
jgi:hypothetical protein